MNRCRKEIKDGRKKIKRVNERKNIDGNTIDVNSYDVNSDDVDDTSGWQCGSHDHSDDVNSDDAPHAQNTNLSDMLL